MTRSPEPSAPVVEDGADSSRHLSAPPDPSRRPVLDWLVVGGGIQGSHIAARLAAVSSGSLDLAVLDPHPRPMYQWCRVTERVGMEFLRSPVVHHLGHESMDLARFAGAPRTSARARHFRGRYRRPSLALFNAHAETVARTAGLEDRWLLGAAKRMRRVRSGAWEVEWDEGRVRARNVVLAIGGGGRLSWPRWAQKLRGTLPAGGITHVLEDADEALLEPTTDAYPDVVVGAGMSGTQLALRLASAGRDVILISRHPVQVARFDTEPGWLGPMRMASFERVRCPDARRAIIGEERHRGSITEDVHHALQAAERRGDVTRILGEVLGAAFESRRVLLTMRESVEPDETPTFPRVVEAARVILATGYDSARPGGAWLDDVVVKEGLPTAACGYPVPDSALRWAPGLFVTGALADLELGPVARNIAGARRAAERVTAVARASARVSRR